MLIAIDTSTAQIGLACYSERGPLGEAVWDSQRDHTAQALPQLDLLLRHLGKQPGDLTAIAVALGPGSWSGIRVGVSSAKGLAIALQLPIIGIGTLDLLVYQFQGMGLPVVPLIRLGRDRFATIGEAGIGARNITIAELAVEAGTKTLFCGDIDSEVRTELTRLLGERARFPGMAASIRRPSFLAELAWKRLQEDQTDDLATLEPIYLGQPVRLAQP